MKVRDRVMLRAISISHLISFIFLTIFFLGYGSRPSISETTMITTLQLDGVLFGFAATLFAFLLKGKRGKEARIGFGAAVTSFVSFFFGILYGFISLLNGEGGNPIPWLAAISFTLAGVMTIIASLVMAGFAEEKGVEP